MTTIFFVIQRIATEQKDDQGNTVYTYGPTDVRNSKAEAEARCLERAKSSPGEFYVAKTVSAVAVEPKMEATT